MNDDLVCYDEISIEMLELLTEFSNIINKVSMLNDCLLTNKLFNSNSCFIQYIYHFGIGRYYHFRCMGYMESLVLTKCYSTKSLCYWKDMLVMPASEHIMEALGYLDKLQYNCWLSNNMTFKALIVETLELKRVAMEIMDLIKSYELSC